MNGRNIADCVLSYAERHGDQVAVHFEDESFLYKDLAGIAGATAVLLESSGLQRGDRLVAAVPNSPEFIFLYLAAAGIGVALVPLSPDLPLSAIDRAAAAAGAKHVVLSSDQGLARRSSEGKSYSLIDIAAISACRRHHASRVDAAAVLRAGDWSDLFILTMTSGSTGDPKPIALSQGNKRNRARMAIEAYGVGPEDVVLAATPLYHSLAERLLNIPLLLGGTAVVGRRFSPQHWCELAERFGVTFTIAVSTQLKQIGAHLASGAITPSRLRTIVSSSAPLDAETRTRLPNLLPSVSFHECYGTSEIAIATTTDLRSGDDADGLVGRPLPDVDVRLVDDEGGDVPQGGVGEIICRTPALHSGYFGKRDETEASMQGDYFRTGDLGRFDEQGRLYFLSRKKDIIISGGINVYPSDVEAAVRSCAGVKDCAAVGIPDDRLGEAVAVVVVIDGTKPVTLRDIQRHCVPLLADFQLPREVRFLAELPKNAMGKLARRNLAALLQGNDAF